MTDKWIRMTSSSPYHNNLLAIEENRSNQYDRKLYSKQIDAAKQKVLDKMTGLPSFEVCPKEKIYKSEFNFDKLSQVALEYRLQTRAEKVIKAEKAFVDGMVSRLIICCVIETIQN